MMYLLAINLVSSVASQSLLDLTTIIIFIFTLLNYRNNKSSVLGWKASIFWVLAAYFIVVCLGFLINAASGAPIREMLFKFIWVFHLYLFYIFFQTVQLSLKNLLKSLCLFLFIPTVYSLICYMTGVDLITGVDSSRIIGMVHSATYHAHGNAVLFIFIFGLALYNFKENKLQWKAFYIFSILSLGLSILLTFTRGVWISLFLSVLFMLKR